MWSSLFLLTLSVATVHLAIENQFWHASEVSVERVTSMRSTQLGSLIRCAMLATEISWSHLFVFKDGVCSLSDMRVGKYLNDSDLGPTIACHTRHMYVCRTNGYTYADGESLEAMCRYYFCDRGTVGNIMKATTCPSPFTEDAVLGCVYLNTVSMTFCDARKWCGKLGADLAFTDFTAIVNYIPNVNELWVGVQAQKWVDGRPTLASEWNLHEPNGPPDDCARLIGQPNPKLSDKSCTKSFPFLCQFPLYKERV